MQRYFKSRSWRHFYQGLCWPNGCPKQDFIEKQWMWHDTWPSMMTHTQNSCSVFNPSKVHTHSSELTHTHTANTHLEQWAAIYAAAPGEQLRVRCLAQGHLSRGIEGEESAGPSLPPPTIPAGTRLELATFQLWVRLSTIRPQLPSLVVPTPSNIMKVKKKKKNYYRGQNRI